MGAALLIYGAILAILVGAVAGGSDPSGYFNEARLFSHLTLHETQRDLSSLPAATARPRLYNPLGYRLAADRTGRLVPTYPPGLSLMILCAAKAVGWRHAGDLVLVLSSLAGLALTYRLGRCLGLPQYWSLAGAILLAMSPIYLYMSLWAMSDVPAMAWATAAVIAAWKASDRPMWALVAGMCAGVAFLVRPSNFLIAAPMLIAIGFSPRRIALTVAGGLPGVIAWMAINHAAYGGYLESGYGAIGTEFHEDLIRGTLGFYLHWLPVVLSPLVIISPAVLAFIGTRTRVTAILVIWALLYFAFYAPYRWTHEEWWYLRFLLPAAPALVVAGLMALHWFFESLKIHYSGFLRGSLLVFLFLGSTWSEVRHIRPLHAWSIGHGEEKYGRVADWLKANAAKNSVVIAEEFSGADYYYTNFVLIRSNELNDGTAEQVRSAIRSEARPVYMVTFPPELELLRGLPGKWVKAGSVEDVTIWRGDWGDPAKKPAGS
jgi:hypothetical protein